MIWGRAAFTYTIHVPRCLARGRSAETVTSRTD